MNISFRSSVYFRDLTFELISAFVCHSRVNWSVLCSLGWFSTSRLIFKNTKNVFLWSKSFFLTVSSQSWQLGIQKCPKIQYLDWLNFKNVFWKYFAPIHHWSNLRELPFQVNNPRKRLFLIMPSKASANINSQAIG